MRVLVVATDRTFTATARLMATLAAGLAARGDVVAMATSLGSETEKAVERSFPRLSVRSVSGAGWLSQAMSVRSIVTALRPDALLLSGEADTVLAAFAAGGRGALVRRRTLDERGRMAARNESGNTLPLRARLVLSRARVTMWGESTPALGWPEPLPLESSANGAIATVHPLPVTAPHVVLVPGREHDDVTALALRSLAHLRSRQADLRVLLLGDAASLQATRVHAAALGLTSGVELLPLNALLHHELGTACAAWIADTGDAGALAALAAMQQGLPVVMSTGEAAALLVSPGITGYIASPHNTVSIVADLARLLADRDAQAAMSAAAVARARREFGWDAFVDAAAEALARAAGVSNTRITRRPSLTPA